MRFGRRSRRPDPADEPGGGDTPAGDHGEPRRRGPWDSEEVDLDSGDEGRVDLGSLVVRAAAGVELRLQVDQASESLVSVLLVGPESAVELRAFAAPKDGGLWDDARRQIADETTRQGGSAAEQPGPHGVELFLERSVETAEGPRVQPARVVGVEGPRWLLRATFLGSAAVSPDEEGLIESAMRDTVVVRGSGPFPPGEQLPLRMPPGVLPQPG